MQCSVPVSCVGWKSPGKRGSVQGAGASGVWSQRNGLSGNTELPGYGGWREGLRRPAGVGLQWEPEVLALADSGSTSLSPSVLAVPTLPSARCRTCRGSSAPTLTNRGHFQVLESSSPVAHSWTYRAVSSGPRGLGAGRKSVQTLPVLRQDGSLVQKVPERSLWFLPSVKAAGGAPRSAGC